MGGIRSFSESCGDRPQPELEPQRHAAQPVGSPRGPPSSTGQQTCLSMWQAAVCRCMWLSLFWSRTSCTNLLGETHKQQLERRFRALRARRERLNRLCRLLTIFLQKLNLSNTGLGAELPALWGVNGSLPSLTSLDVSRNLVSGGQSAWCAVSICLCLCAFRMSSRHYVSLHGQNGLKIPALA